MAPAKPPPVPPPTPIYTLKINFTLQVIKHDNSTVDILLPSNVGTTGGIWVNHTLDAWGIPGSRAPMFTRPLGNDNSSTTYDGFIYVQPTDIGHVFTLADFFNLWGQHITDTCISVSGYVDNCTGPGGTLVMEVNKSLSQTIANHQLRDGEEIWVAYIES